MAKSVLDEKFGKELEKLTPLYKLLIYVLVSLFAAMVSFKFILPLLEEEETDLKDKIEVIRNEISENSSQILQRKIKRLREEFLKKSSEKEKLKEDLLLLESKLKKFSFKADDKKITNILNMLLEKSLELNLDIESIKPVSNPKESEEKIKLKKEIHIKGRGEFANIVYFLHFIEETDVLSDIREVELKKGKDSVEFSFVWLIYGVEL